MKEALHSCHTSHVTLGVRLTPLSSAVLWCNSESVTVLLETPFTMPQQSPYYVEWMGPGHCCYCHDFLILIGVISPWDVEV